MSNEQEAAARFAHIIEKHLQTIVDGRLPHSPDVQINLDKRRERADWELASLLGGIVSALPEHVRVSVQACLDLNAHIWSEQYRQVYEAAQKEASSTCLAAVNSL